jgi:hypothetical protein
VSLPPNLEEMKTGEVARIAREHGIPNVEQMDKQEMIEALSRKTGERIPVASQARGQRGKDPAPAGTSPQDWKNIPGNQS